MSGHYLYPIWVRVWHWTNAVLFVVLAITGISMHYAEPGMPQVDFRTARIFHNAAGMAITAGYAVFAIGNLLSGNGRHYRPRGGDLPGGALRQIRYYLSGIFRGEPQPYPHSEEAKFNPMQRLTYLVVMYVLFPVLTVTGWVLFFPDRVPDRLAGMPGVSAFALAHAAVGYALSLFAVVHVYLGTTGETPWALFRAMVTGYAGGDGHNRGGQETTTAVAVDSEAHL